MIPKKPTPMTPHLSPPRLDPTPPPPNGERHAQALADIRSMHDELASANETIGQLKADLNRAEDRLTLVLEERDKYRDEAHVFRARLIELATQQANIGLLTIKAQEIVRVVEQLTTPPLRSADALMASVTDAMTISPTHEENPQ